MREIHSSTITKCYNEYKVECQDEIFYIRKYFDKNFNITDISYHVSYDKGEICEDNRLTLLNDSWFWRDGYADEINEFLKFPLEV